MFNNNPSTDTKKAKLESYYFSKTLIQLSAEIFKKKKKKNTEIIKFYSHN